MDTITISSKKPFSLENLRKLLSEDKAVTAPNENTVVVHEPDSRTYLRTRAAGIAEHRESYELLLDYSSVELAKSVIEKIANDPSLTVDNDFGTVLPGDKFVSKCRTNKEWDWRRDLNPFTKF